MSKKFALSSKLPGEPDINGLDALHGVITDDPGEKIVCALVWLAFPTSNRNNDTGELRHTALVRRIEPFGTVDKVPAAVIKLAGQLQEARTGVKPLPFDQIESKLDHVEILDGREDQ